MVMARNLCCGTVKGDVYHIWLHVCIYGCRAFDHVHWLKLTGVPERPCNPNSPIGPGTPFRTNNNNDKNGKHNEVSTSEKTGNKQ